MRVLIPHTYCDICRGDHDQQTDADESLTIKFTKRGRHLRLDLCPEHKDPTWSQIEGNAIDDLDEPAPPARKAPKVPCELCGKPHTDTITGRALHLAHQHSELSLEERQRIAGTVRVGQRHTPRGDTAPLAHPTDLICPLCDHVPFARTQTLANHLVQAHDMTDKDERRAVLAEAKNG